MEANELRIGNWIDTIHGFAIVDSVNKNVYNSVFVKLKGFSGSYDKINPIPLTPEILENAGFKIINHIHGYSFYTMNREGRHNKDKPNIDIYQSNTLYCGYRVNHCKYLHQLQNLYFTLTGEELKIEL